MKLKRRVQKGLIQWTVCIYRARGFPATRAKATTLPPPLLLPPLPLPLLPLTPNKLFTQDELNKILAEDKRKHQAALAKVEAKLQETLKSATLSEQDRKTLEENLQAVQGQLRTKEQQAALERKQLEEQYQARVVDIEKKAIFFETLYRDSTIERALQDAAVKNDAFSPSQIITQVRPWTKMIEIMDEKTGKGTGKYKPVVDMPDVDATTGEQVVMTRTPEEAVKRMKELPEHVRQPFQVRRGLGNRFEFGYRRPRVGSGREDQREESHA